MAIQSVELVEYLNALSRVEDPVLQRMEAEAQRDRFPIIGPAIKGGKLFGRPLIDAV